MSESTPEVTAVADDSDEREIYRAIAAGQRADGERGVVALCVSSNDLESGRGDLYVGLGLAKALSDRGWGIELWPTDRWTEPGPAGVRAAIFMVESHVPGLIPDDVHAIAWVRNWTSRWAQLPYLSAFSQIWCSSSEAADRMREVTDVPVHVVPLATDPDLFPLGEDDGDRERIGGVVTTANSWGVPRAIEQALSELAIVEPVVWYGANPDAARLDARVDRRDKIDYFEIPAIYREYEVVIDDLIDAAAEFGTQNSRLFDALASGALVISNTGKGLDELGLSDVPIYSDSENLHGILTSLRQTPGARAELAARLRDVVVARHTWAHRAEAVEKNLDALPSAVPERDEVLAFATRLREELRAESEHASKSLGAYYHVRDEYEKVRIELDELHKQMGEIFDSRAYRVGAGLTGPISVLKRTFRGKQT